VLRGTPSLHGPLGPPSLFPWAARPGAGVRHPTPGSFPENDGYFPVVKSFLPISKTSPRGRPDLRTRAASAPLFPLPTLVHHGLDSSPVLRVLFPHDAIASLSPFLFSTCPLFTRFGVVHAFCVFSVLLQSLARFPISPPFSDPFLLPPQIAAMPLGCRSPLQGPRVLFCF